MRESPRVPRNFVSHMLSVLKITILQSSSVLQHIVTIVNNPPDDNWPLDECLARWARWGLVLGIIVRSKEGDRLYQLVAKISI